MTDFHTTDILPCHIALTGREVEVLQLIAAGHTNAQIGRQLYIGVNTVKTHVKHLFRKLGAEDRAGAVGNAFRAGLLS
ncbi:helix-turn-helix transcriptional regulator [Actinoplanes sp. NPDC023936]|uniref:response regulator transcription factor n=1 Tax=Actinoplanes sp. NPDC023936 TaxID=3154910 RepID=UPI0033D4DA10